MMDEAVTIDNINRWIAELDSSEWGTLKNAKSNLKKAGATAIGLLSATLRNDWRFWVREEAAELLGEIGDIRAIDVLIEALNDSNRFVRLKAAIALGRMNDARVEEALADVVERDLDPNVRYNAISCIHKCESPRVVAALFKALKDSNEKVRTTAASRLTQAEKLPLDMVLGAATDGSLPYDIAKTAIGKIQKQLEKVPPDRGVIEHSVKPVDIPYVIQRVR